MMAISRLTFGKCGRLPHDRSAHSQDRIRASSGKVASSRSGSPPPSLALLFLGVANDLFQPLFDCLSLGQGVKLTGRSAPTAEIDSLDNVPEGPLRNHTVEHICQSLRRRAK